MRMVSSSCIESVKNRYLQTCCELFKQLAIKLAVKQVDNQLASSLLTTWSRLVIIKPEQAMRTHPHIGLTMLQRN